MIRSPGMTPADSVSQCFVCGRCRPARMLAALGPETPSIEARAEIVKGCYPERSFGPSED